MTSVRYPDLLVAFGVNPEAYYQANAYIIEEQGKPPDFVMEIASPSTPDQDATDKRHDYEALGIPEYWRFDENPTSNRPKLAGDRLSEGSYVPIPIDEPSPGISQGYSQALGLLIRWEQGHLRWIDPQTEDHIPTIQSERQGRIAAEQERDTERQARLNAEAQLRDLRAELNSRRDND